MNIGDNYIRPHSQCDVSTSLPLLAVSAVFLYLSLGTVLAADSDPAPMRIEPLQVRLPAPIDDVVPVAGGALLALKYEGLPKAALFDPIEAKVIQTWTLVKSRAFIAGGAEKVVVVLPDADILQEFDLNGVERRVAFQFPSDAKIGGAAMGSSSAGPVVVLADSGGFAFDAKSLAPIRVQYERVFPHDWGLPPTQFARIRAAADGSAFAAWRENDGGGHRRLLRIENGIGVARLEDTGSGQQFPSADGECVFGRHNWYRLDGTTIKGTELSGVCCIATDHPDFFFTLRPYNDREERQLILTKKSLVTLYSSRPRRCLAAIEGFAEWGGLQLKGIPVSGLAFDRYLHLLPRASRVVTVAEDRKSLFVRHFDFGKSLERTGDDFCIVLSMPPPTAKPGTDWSYATRIVSRGGLPLLKLESAPPSMTLTNQGTLSWRVPVGLTDDRTDVILRITTTSGLETYHSFTLWHR